MMEHDARADLEVEFSGIGADGPLSHVGDDVHVLVERDQRRIELLDDAERLSRQKVVRIETVWFVGER